MQHIQCPSDNEFSSNCKWLPIDGSVRDRPDVGLVQCTKCELITHKIDLSAEVKYASGTMHNWTSGYSDALLPPIQDVERRLVALKALSKASKKKLLDFGCGSGTMLSALSGDFDTYGLEPDEGAKLSAQNSGHQVFSDTDEILDQNLKFDFVTLFHVVEHFYEPSTEFERIHRLLNPGGYLVIETPNSNDALISFYKNQEFQNFTYWSHHPMLHSSKSLGSMVKGNGFKVVENSGVQRYGINNHLYWLAIGKPGGHEIWKSWIPAEIEALYEEMLVKKMACDTLWLIAQR